MIDIRDLKVGDKVMVHWRDDCDEVDEVVSIQEEVPYEKPYSIELLKYGWYTDLDREDLDFV